MQVFYRYVNAWVEPVKPNLLATQLHMHRLFNLIVLDNNFSLFKDIYSQDPHDLKALSDNWYSSMFTIQCLNDRGSQRYSLSQHNGFVLKKHLILIKFSRLENS